MRRFLGLKEAENIIINDAQEVKHIVKVNRNKVGDNIEVIVDDSCFECEITSITKRRVLCSVVKEIRSDKEFEITLIIAAVKGSKLEEMIRHATELGVSNIIITNTKRTANPVNPNKLERYKKVVLSALKQSKAFQRTEIAFAEYDDIDFSSFSETLLFHPKADTSRIKDAKDNAAIFIGPEGGFCEEELDDLLSRGITLAKLGTNILRAETAALSAVSIYLHELGVM